MKRKFTVPKRVLGLGLIAVVAIAALAVTTGGAAVHMMTPSVAAGPVVHNLGALDSAPGQIGRLRQCQLNGVCYGPDQIRDAYGFQPLLDKGTNGAGSTIVIIDAYGSDTLQQDFNTNNAYWGLPSQTIDVRYPDGLPEATTPGNRAGWKDETTLDVNTAHYIAPNAKIVLVVAKSNNDSDILSATQYVADNNLGDVVSQSYGEAEQCMGSDLLAQQQALFQQMTNEGMTILASAGDDGAAQPTCDGSGLFKAASTPASDPNVTAIGGTDLVATAPTGTQKTSTSASPSFEKKPGGDYISESVWNEGVEIAGGGGISTVYSKPSYQNGAVSGSMRGIPDVTYSASLGHSILVIESCTSADTSACGSAGTFVFGYGGTSAGSPQWAGLVALADQLKGGRIGLMNPTLYSLSNSSYFHDVTTGDNSVPADPSVSGTPITGFSATKGWDAASGLGSPKANSLVPALASH
ncbi:MAG TPA: S53 family peptidase [Gaiellaceae bacterium]|nr:S53 family peptidase [Gaiellaceae bacterium]